MQMPKHSDQAKEYFRSLVPDLPSVEVRPMFGSVGAFVNGHMFAGLFGDNVGVKLSPDSLAELATLPGQRTVRARATPDGRLLVAARRSPRRREDSVDAARP